MLLVKPLNLLAVQTAGQCPALAWESRILGFREPSQSLEDAAPWMADSENWSLMVRNRQLHGQVALLGVFGLFAASDLNQAGV